MNVKYDRIEVLGSLAAVDSLPLSAEQIEFSQFGRTKVQWLGPVLQGRRFISPSGLRLSAEGKQSAQVEERLEGVLRMESRRDSHPTLRCPPSSLQWSRDIAAMASLVWTRAGEKWIEGPGEKVVRDPYVMGSGQLERLHCSAAGSGRTAHQAGWWSLKWACSLVGH